jgi:hypothetical protein
MCGEQNVRDHERCYEKRIVQPNLEAAYQLWRERREGTTTQPRDNELLLGHYDGGR